MHEISVTVLTKNSEKYLQEVLEALTLFAEVLIYDTGSTDSTLAIASRFANVRVVEGNFDGFGTTHNRASAAASHDWILSIDSDEVVTSAMCCEIANLALNSDAVYSFPRDNYYNNRHIRWCGWYPDRQNRLYNRKKTKFTDAKVHEGIITDQAKIIPLHSPFIHYSYDSVSEFLKKMQSYSDLFAQQNQGKKDSSLCKAVLHGLFAFFKSYILKKGIVGGREGFEISLYNANTAFYKYLKLLEYNQRLATGSRGSTKSDFS